MTRKFFPLSAVTGRLQQILEPATRRVFWVQAEISSARQRGGVFFCDLVETSQGGRVVATLACRIWAQDLERIRAKFRAVGLEPPLEEGAVVGLCCRLRYDPRHGLCLVGLDMDPAFSLGLLELQRRRILERLAAEGLLAQNASRPVPLLPSRIALVASRASAAFHDFTRTLFATPFGFRVYHAECVVQGRDTEKQVLRALEVAEQLPVDLVVLVRGGGSRVDLSFLDNEAIARRIAALRLPVWTGIGHDVDTSVLDRVAAAAFKTPTAVAEELVGRFERTALRAEEASKRLEQRWRAAVETERHRLGEARTGLRQGTRKLLAQWRSEVRAAANALGARVRGRLARNRALLEEERRAGLRRRVRYRLEAERARAERWRGRLRGPAVAGRVAVERARVEASARTLRAVDPRRTLERGFALVRDEQGAPVREVRQLRAGREVEMEFADGSARGRVASVQPSEVRQGAAGAAPRSEAKPSEVVRVRGRVEDGG